MQSNQKNVKAFEISTGKEYLLEKVIQLQFMNPAVEKGVYILHDKDVDVNGDPIKPHWHVFVKLKYAQRICHIAKWYDVPENFVNHIRKWSRALMYATHSTEDAKIKFQYSDDDVKFYPDSYDWKKDREKGDTRRIDWQCEEIENGRIQPHHVGDTRYISEKEWRKYKIQYERAFEYRRRKALSMEEIEMQVIFITGESGVGKTTYAKELAKGKGYSFFVAGGTNDPFDGYGGQDCVILDEIRPENVELSDLLKWTDNHTRSMVKSRWYNKVINEVKLIIITSIRSLEDFYKLTQNHEEAMIKQLRRRVFGYVKMTKEEIIFKVYNEKYDKFDENFVLPNKIREIHKKTEQDEQKKIEDIKQIMIGLGNGLKKTAEHINEYAEQDQPASQQHPKSASGERKAKRKSVRK